MVIERSASNTLVVMARETLSPSYWLLHFNDPDRNSNAYCIVQAGNATGAMITLTFTEVASGAVATSGQVTLSPPGNWQVTIYEQTSSSNLNTANANRLVYTQAIFVEGGAGAETGWTDECPSTGDECDPLTVEVNGTTYGTLGDPCGATFDVDVVQDGTPVGSLVGGEWVIPSCGDLSYELVNSATMELESGTVPDPCGETLQLIAPDGIIRTTNTLLTVGQVPSGDVFNLPQTSVMYSNGTVITSLFLTDTTFDGVNLQTDAHILAAELRNSLGNVVGATIVDAADLMNDTVPIAPDGDITFDGLPVGTVPSGDTTNLDCGTLLDGAYVQDGGSVTGNYFGTGTLNGREVYTKDVDHNLEYTGTRWRLVKPGSDVDAALGSETYPWEADWSATSVTVEQATIGSYCGGNQVQCSDLTIAINGTTYGTVADPCGATAPVDVHDSNGNDVGSLVSGAWVVAAPANVLHEYTTGGTWNKPTAPSFKGVWVFAAGGGGSGGAGAINNTNVSGGSAGGGGSLVRLWIPAASLGLTETYAIGAGGAGVATGAGGAGGATLFGAHVEAKGGSAGAAGQTTTSSIAGGAGGNATLNTPVVNGASISGGAGGFGARSSAAIGDGTTGVLNAAAPGGGGGTGVNSTTAGGNGRSGGGAWSTSLTAGGAGGISPGGNGTAGVSDIYLNPFLGLVTPTIGIGTGGGGGAGATTANAGAGAAGGRAAGGGGGGSCYQTPAGFIRGASGAGGNGFLLVYEMYAI